MVAAPARSIFLLTIFASALLAQTSGQLQFREIGPAVVGGRIEDFAVVETDPDIIYVGTASGGAWETSDGAITRACDLYRSGVEAASRLRDLRTALTATLNAWKSPSALRTDAEAFSKKIDDLAPLLTGGGGPLAMPQTYRRPPIPERVAHVLVTFENYTAAPRARDVEQLDQVAAAEQDALVRLNKSFADSGVAYIALPAHPTGRN